MQNRLYDSVARRTASIQAAARETSAENGTSPSRARKSAANAASTGSRPSTHCAVQPPSTPHLAYRREGSIPADCAYDAKIVPRSEEHTSELQSLMRISYAVFCLKKKTK